MKYAMLFNLIPPSKLVFT